MRGRSARCPQIDNIMTDKSAIVGPGEAGAEHAKTFTVTVTCNEELLGTGTARRKKDAEQLAAKEAMEKIDEQRVSDNNA